MDAAAIETSGLVKRFGSVTAVAGLDLTVRQGDVFGFLGPNGAGKTTTIRMFVALLRPSAGEIRLFGETVRPGARALSRVGSLVERPAFYPYLSAIDNLLLLSAARGVSSSEARPAIAAALERTGLTAVGRRNVGGFSTGMRQRLGLSFALLHRPALVILDEPTNGLDPSGVVEVRSIISGLAREGTTVFLSSHVLTEVEQLCDRVAVLSRGHIVAEGRTGDLLGGRERLLIRFDTEDEAGAARRVLLAAGLGVERLPDGTSGPTAPSASPARPAGWLVDARASDGSRIARTLGEAGIYPAELSVDRPSLEDVFLELTGEEAPVGDVPPGAAGTGTPS
jgi:ABC-2 type transport system ATP-binding protein